MSNDKYVCLRAISAGAREYSSIPDLRSSEYL